MAKTNLHAFKAKDTRFVADWLKSKGLHKLCSVFKGIQEPFILLSLYIIILSLKFTLAVRSAFHLDLCCQLNHVYIHSFRSIIKATEKFPGGGGI